MSDRTAIEWAANADGSPGATWNPIVGCSVLTPGCTNCYAMREAARNERQIAATGGVSPYAGLTKPSKAGPVWTGEVRLIEHTLRKPLSWKKPRTIFVNSMGDLFHDAVPAEWIDRVFAVMALCPQHTFIVLTKRSARMREYVLSTGETLGRQHELRAAIESITPWPADALGHHVSTLQAIQRVSGTFEVRAPLPNVWLGVSVERNEERDRLTDLIHTPAALRLVSAEPLLAPLDLSPFFGLAFDGDRRKGKLLAGLDWVIAGGESGEGARPMHPDWARQLRDQCRAAHVPFFFKQWGAWAPVGPLYSDDDTDEHLAALECQDGEREALLSLSGTRWSDDAQPPPGTWAMRCVGKRAAGRELDGCTHDDRPPLTRSAA